MAQQEPGIVRVDISKEVTACFDVHNHVLRVFNKESGRQLMREDIEPSLTIGEFSEMITKLQSQL